MTVSGVARRHRRRRISVYVGNDGLAPGLELTDEPAEPTDDLTDDLVHAATHIEIDVRLHTKFLQHPATEILVIVLTGVDEECAVTTLLEFLKERHLLDDIRLGRDHDQMESVCLQTGNVIEEPRIGEGDLFHKRWKL